MWNALVEFLKQSADKILCLFGCLLCLLAFFEIRYTGGAWSLSLNTLPNLYLLVTGAILLLGFALVHGRVRSLPNKPADGANWLETFASIGVSPLAMYGLTDLATSPALDARCLYHLWADPLGNSISAQFRDGCYVLVFENRVQGAYPCDVTLRPSGYRALSNAHPQRTLCHSGLSLRLRCTEVRNTESISVCFRLVDRLGTQWAYRGGAEFYFPLELVRDQCEEFVLNLAAPERWALFTPDGNGQYHGERPDFSAIGAVVLELGGHNGTQRPTLGAGTVVVQNISLRDAQ